MGHVTSCVPCDFSLQSFVPRAAQQPHLAHAHFLFPSLLPESVLSHVITLYKGSSVQGLMCPVRARRSLHTAI